MVNQYVWIGIAVGVFVAGIAIGYTFLQANTSNFIPMSSQQMQQMMNNPQTMNQWHQQMMRNPQAMNQWMNTMMNDPILRQQMYDTMVQNQQFMHGMMSNQQFQQNWMGPWMMQNNSTWNGMKGPGMMNP